LVSLNRLDYSISLLFDRTFEQADTVPGVKGIGFYKVVSDGSGGFAKHVGNDSIKGYIADGKDILESILFAGFAGNKLKPKESSSKLNTGTRRLSTQRHVR